MRAPIHSQKPTLAFIAAMLVAAAPSATVEAVEPANGRASRNGFVPKPPEKELKSSEESPGETESVKRAAETPTPELQAVVERLKSSDAKVREAACAELIAFQPTLPRTAADALVEVIAKDADDNVRFVALTLLHYFLADGERAAPILVESLKSPGIDDPFRINTCFALGFVGSYDKDLVSDVLADQLASKDVSAHAKCVAAQSLGMISTESDKALDALLANIDSSESYVDAEMNGAKRYLRDSCLTALAEVRRPYPKAVPILIKKLEGGKPAEVKLAVLALKGMGPGAGEAAPALMALIEGKQPVFRSLAFPTLEAIGPAASATLPNLLKAFEQEQRSSARAVVLRTLAHVGRKEPKDVVPLLLTSLTSRDGVLRGAAYDGLTVVGPGAKEAIPILEAIVEDNPRNRDAIIALDSIVGIDARDEYIAMLSSERRGERNRGCLALMKIGPPAREALSAMISLAKEPDILAIQALGPVGGDESVPDLVKFLEFDDYKIVDAAVGSLAAAGPSAKAALPNLEAVAKNRDMKSALRIGALKAITKIRYPSGD